MCVANINGENATEINDKKRDRVALDERVSPYVHTHNILSLAFLIPFALLYIRILSPYCSLVFTLSFSVSSSSFFPLMFEERFMDFGGFLHGDFNIGRASSSDHHHRLLPDSGVSGGFFQSLDPHPFQKNHQRGYSSNSDKALDLCHKLSQMGISCDMSVWSRPDPANLHGASSRIYNDSSVSHGFDHNLTPPSSVFHGEPRLLGFQDSGGFEEMMALMNHRDLLLNRISSSSVQSLSFGNDARVSRSLAAMEVSRKLEAFYPEDSLIMGQGSYEKKMGTKNSNGLPLNLVSMVKIYGSVNLMAKDQIGCRVLQKFVDQGTVLDAKVIFLEIIDYVGELSMDPFGNYLIQKLLEVCDEEHRTLLVSVLTSKPMELIRICLNTYG